ncbi:MULTISPECIES: hypothetical protein [unclassified Micromonospora]|uniref:hypothetical protein n=1 Tax=unclassified Micromonospora TaxID=2617518 RepID=UPI0033293A9F
MARKPRRRKVWLHRGLASMWVLLAIPGTLWWAQSILFVILVSLYANFASELAAAEASDDRDVLERLDRIEKLLAERAK